MVLPEQNLIPVFTGLELHEEPDDEVFLNRLLPTFREFNLYSEPRKYER